MPFVINYEVESLFACFNVRNNFPWRKANNVHSGPSLGVLAYSRDSPIGYFWHMCELPGAQSIKNRAQNQQQTVFPTSSYLPKIPFLILQYKTKYCASKFIL
jgi:hypothetical protein